MTTPRQDSRYRWDSAFDDLVVWLAETGRPTNEVSYHLAAGCVVAVIATSPAADKQQPPSCLTIALCRERLRRATGATSRR
jgi:hypothetical protein